MVARVLASSVLSGSLLAACASAPSHGTPMAAGPSPSIAGDWIGSADQANGRAQVRIRLTQDGGKWKGTLDMPSSDEWGVDATNVVLKHGLVELDVRWPKSFPSERDWHFIGDVRGDRMHATLTHATTRWSIVLARAAVSTPPDEATLARLAGHYAESTSASDEDDVVIAKVGPHLLRVDRLTALELFPTGDGTFLVSADQGGRFLIGSASQPPSPPVIELAQRRLTRRTLPYTTGEMHIRAKGVLRGTVRVPKEPAAAKHPGVLLIGGGGPSTGYGAYWDAIAEHLARHGFAVLAYDKRGAGLSEGNWMTASLEELADDAVAALDALRAHPQVDPARVGMWATSGGGFVVPIAATKSSHVAFGILAASSAMTVAGQWPVRLEHRMRAAGASQSDIDGALAFAQEYVGVSQKGVVSDAFLRALAVARTKPWARYVDEVSMPLEDQPLGIKEYADGREQETLLSLIRFPVLAIWGDKERNFPVEVHRPRMEKLLRERGNPDVTTLVVPNANHPFFVARTGTSEELRRAQSPDSRMVFAPGYLDAVTTWLTARFLDSRPR